MNTSLRLLAILAVASLVSSACSSEGTKSSDPSCEGDKCDDPNASANAQCQEECDGDSECFKECRDAAALDHCALRRSEALDGSQRAFTADWIRWGCADVDGVTTNGKDDRGQEYCEYYAAVQLPPEVEGGELPDIETPGIARASGGAEPLSLELSEDQIFALEDEPDAVVGQCVFTSWHSDIQIPYPICGESDVSCPKLGVGESAQLPSWHDSREYDLPLASAFMRMKGPINSNNAAADLFQKCLTDPPEGDPQNPEDPLHDDFTRGCWNSYQLFQTEWRRSDPALCAAGARLSECGCGVDVDGDSVADVTDPEEVSRMLVPFQPDGDGNVQLRGFHLGTWSGPSELPAGCRYVDTGEGEDTKTLVSCDLTATDVLSSAQDPKGRCREKYGDNVVIHVPIPSASIVCSPPADGQYAGTCGDMPWVLE